MVVYGWNHLHYICKSGLNSSDGLNYLWDRSVGNHQSLQRKIILTDFEFRTQRMNELSVIGLFYQCGHFHEQENKYRDCEIERRISVYLSFYLITLLRTWMLKTRLVVITLWNKLFIELRYILDTVEYSRFLILPKYFIPSTILNQIVRTWNYVCQIFIKETFSSNLSEK